MDVVKELWDGIMFIYLKKGQKYTFEYKGLRVVSEDNYFICHFDQDNKNYSFRIYKKYSFNSSVKYELNCPVNDRYSFGTPNLFLRRLKSLFRESKLEEII